ASGAGRLRYRRHDGYAGGGTGAGAGYSLRRPGGGGEPGGGQERSPDQPRRDRPGDGGGHAAPLGAARGVCRRRGGLKGAPPAPQSLGSSPSGGMSSMPASSAPSSSNGPASSPAASSPGSW